MNAVRRQGQVRNQQESFRLRLSAPVALVSGAVVLIGVVSALSTSGVHASLPTNIDLPLTSGRAPSPPPARPHDVNAAANPARPSSASGALPVPAATSTTAAGAHGVERSIPLQSASVGASTGTSGNRTETTTTVVRDDNAEPVSPDYPVVTSVPDSSQSGAGSTTATTDH